MIYLSDVSRDTCSGRLPKILTDAKRRSGGMGILYQCDRSLSEAGAGQANEHGHRLHLPIAIQSTSYAKGIGIATPFVLTYQLGGSYTRFSAVVGVDDAAESPEDWVFEVYLDDVIAGTWRVAKDEAVSVEVDTTGAEELVLVGAGPDRMFADLAEASLTEAAEPVEAAATSPTCRQAIFELDDRLIQDSEVLLISRMAKKIDADTGPDETAAALGGYGRITSSRGADMWAAIKDKGDLLRWQALVRRPGEYRAWVRVVSSAAEANPNAEDYHVCIDGKRLNCRLAPQTIVERMPEDRFTGHLWGYIAGDVFLDPGWHDVEVANASGAWLAVNRVVLVSRGKVAESLRPAPPLRPLAACRETVASDRWAPKALVGRHYVGADDGQPFTHARELGLMFAPSLTGSGAEFSNADEESMRQMLDAKLPFTIHVRFNSPHESPVMAEEAYQRIRDLAGELWQGFWTTEWSDCFMSLDPYSSDERPRPKTRADAYDRVKAWFKRHAADCYDDLLPMCTTWHWDHYAGEWTGVSGFQDEPGISPESQLRILFARGAARQYGKLWHTYIAPGAHDAGSWIQNGYMLNDRPYNTGQTPTGGSSISWVKRMLYLSYMWGAASLKNETPAYLTDMTPDGSTALSPMGLAADEFFTFAATHEDRGTCCTPIGIMLDYLHGWGGHPIYPDAYPPLTWQCLPPDASDYMKDALFQAVYPGQFDELNEWNILSPTPHGDLFDVMLSTATAEHVAAYPILMLVGDLAADMDGELAGRLRSYVDGGGTLVINVEQLAGPLPEETLGVRLTDKTGHADSARCALDGHKMKGGSFALRVVELAGAEAIISTPAGDPLVTRHEVGDGAVVLTTVPFLLQENLNGVCFMAHLLEHLTSGLFPFRVAGDVEYVVNRTSDSWLVTLVNNRGIYKLPTELEMIDDRQSQRAHITLAKEPAHLADWMTDQSLTALKVGQTWQLAIDVPPGDVKIVQIRD